MIDVSDHRAAQIDVVACPGAGNHVHAQPTVNRLHAGGGAEVVQPEGVVARTAQDGVHPGATVKGIVAGVGAVDQERVVTVTTA